MSPEQAEQFGIVLELGITIISILTALFILWRLGPPDGQKKNRNCDSHTGNIEPFQMRISNVPEDDEESGTRNTG